MTSTTFSNKTFLKLYQWALKRNKIIILTFGIIMAVGILLDIYGIYTFYVKDEQTFGEIGEFSITMAQIGAMLLTFISSLVTFSFLHNKRSVDMFGSLPATRGTLYFSHLLGGITSVAVPFTVGSLIVMAVTCRTTEFLAAELWQILFGIIGIAAAYSFTTLIAYCCGTAFDSALLTVAVNVVYIGIVLYFWGMSSAMIPGVMFESVIFAPVVTLLAPYAFCFFLDTYYFSDFIYRISTTSSFVSLLIWSILFTAAMVVFGYFLAKKHKAEGAQSEINIKWLPVIVKAGGSLICGGMVGMAMASTSRSGYTNMFIFALWYTTIGFAAFIILHFLFSRNFKSKFIPSLIAYLVTTVAVISLAFGFTFGMGIDTYVPEPSVINSVQFGGDEYKDPNNIKLVTEIHKTVIDAVRKQNKYPYYLGSDDDQEDSDIITDLDNEKIMPEYPLLDSINFDFRYTSKMGVSTLRWYDMYDVDYDREKVQNLLKELYNSEESKKNTTSPLLWDKELRKEYTVVQQPDLYYIDGRLADGDNDMEGRLFSVQLPKDESFVSGLLDVLAEDIIADEDYLQNYGSNSSRYTTLKEAYLTVTIDFKGSKSNYPPYRYYRNYGGYYMGEMDYIYMGEMAYIRINIPQSYQKTRQYLSDHNISTEYTVGMANAAFSGPSGYISESSEAFDYYQDFSFSGDVTDLDCMMEELTAKFEYIGLVRSGIGTSFADWDTVHHNEMVTVVRTKARELYNTYKKDPKYIKSDYNNVFTQGTEDVYEMGGYLYMADQIIMEIDKSAEQLVKNINANAAPSNNPSTDTSKAA